MKRKKPVTIADIIAAGDNSKRARILVARFFASIGGKAGRGECKARTRKQAQAAINKRWANREGK